MSRNAGESQNEDWRGLGDLVALATERIVMPVEGMHRAIADRWFALAGTAGAPLRDAYNGATRRVYGAIRGAGGLVGSALGWGASVAGTKAEPLWSKSAGERIQANVNAIWGDELARRVSPLALQFGFRTSAGEPIDPGEVATILPEGTSRVAVLIHGLGETERCWSRDAEGSIGCALAADGIATIGVRYNSGRRISESAEDLAALLERLFAEWPGEALEEISLIGNSMGGLVARSALNAGLAAGHSWVRPTRHVVTIGSPHLGAPLEKGAALVAQGLRLVPESRPIGEFLNLRSAGIKDLRFGSRVESEWEGVEQHFVAGVVTTEPSHPVGFAIGDLMVRVASSTAQGRTRKIPATNFRVFGGRRHFDLVTDAAVHDQLREWLTPRDIASGDDPDEGVPPS